MADGVRPVADHAPVTVIGLADARLELLAPEARLALAEADVVVGERHHLAAWEAWRRPPAGDRPLPPPAALEVGGDIDEVVRAVQRRAIEGSGRVCVLASGDPGFFGIVRELLQLIDRRSLRVLPAPSSVSLAFARLGLPWDDAVVVSAQGRPLAEAVGAIRTARKVAVLTSPDVPPEAVGWALLEAGVAMDLVAVCSQLGTAGETVQELTLRDLAGGRFDPLSVVVLVGPGGLPLAGWGPGPARVLAWGLPEGLGTHGSGAVATSEVRSVILAKLSLPEAGVLWDVGPGSGGVALECALVRPSLTVLAIEEDPGTAARISAGALTTGASVHVVHGEAPQALEGLPAPDRVFVGGGGLAVLEPVLERLRPGGRLVATFAAMDRAAAAAERLGGLAQVAMSRGERLPDGGWQLVATSPVFVVWGPGGETFPAPITHAAPASGAPEPGAPPATPAMGGLGPVRSPGPTVG